MAETDAEGAVDIRSAHRGDAAAITALYNHYVTDTLVTFEETPVTADDMGQRIQTVRSAGLPWLVARRTEALIGYAYATPWKARVGYRFTVEVSVYVAPGLPRRGIGSALYRVLFAQIAEAGMKVIIGGIALPNPGSVALHEKMGMRKVAHFDAVGIKQGRWVDVGYWQRRLEEA